MRWSPPAVCCCNSRECARTHTRWRISDD
jgi:hypothetical protein